MYDFPIVLQVMSIVLQVKTSPAIRLENRIQVISNRLCICDKTSDVDPIICTLATCKQPICTSASPRYRLVGCRWLLYRLLDRRLRFCHRFSQSIRKNVARRGNGPSCCEVSCAIFLNFLLIKALWVIFMYHDMVHVF